MLYKPITGLVNVGYNREEKLFHWEEAEAKFAARARSSSLEMLAESLREFNVEQLQIRNIGTKSSYLSKRLRPNEYKRLREYLEKPLAFVIKSEPSKRDLPKILSIHLGKDVFLDYPFSVLIRGEEHYCTLGELPETLARVGAVQGDIRFRKKVGERLSLLNSQEYKSIFYVFLIQNL